MPTKSDRPVIGHIGIIRPKVSTRSRRKRPISAEEKERLIEQAKAAYEIRITPA